MLLSNERLHSYQRVFQPANDMELMGVYLWNAQVCGTLYPLMGMVEITLRNAIDTSLTADLGQFWWAGGRLHYRSFSPGASEPHAVEAVRENFAKATRQYAAEQRRRHGVRGHVPPLHHGVIAKTEFSTWEFLLDVEFLGRGYIWPKHLSSVFRGRWPTTQAKVLLSHVRALVAMLRDFRNRLFHHEPAWKRYGVLTEEDALLHLREKIGKVEELLALIHPEALQCVQANGLLRKAYRTCSIEEIRYCQGLMRTQKINSMAKLAQTIDLANAENRAVKVRVLRGQKRRFLIVPL